MGQGPIFYVRNMERDEALQTLLTTTLAAIGYELWGYELQSHSQLRVYIEHEPGVTIDDCQRAAQHISSALDVEALLPEDYSLEVSSPGVERLLFNREQYAHYQGSPVKIRLRELFQDHRRYQGKIKTVTDETLVLLVDEVEIPVPLQLIEKANLVFVESNKQKK